ncbi:MAG: hypothetical protein M3141_05545 [Actinomycetota bacterium]|nr:hypothetical protein [Actinomycetota bacterium]
MARFTWQLVATCGYCVLFVLIAAVLELTTVQALIPAGVLVAYALSAQLYPRPWRYWLATGPWLLILSWFAALWDGGLDCGAECDDGWWFGNVLLTIVAVGFVAVIVGGPVVWLIRRLR